MDMVQNRLTVLFLCYLILASAALEASENKDSLISERLAMIQSFTDKTGDIAAAENFLQSADPVMRRTAARLLTVYYGDDEKQLAVLYNHDDSIISRTALQQLCDKYPEESLVYAEDALRHKEEMVKLAAISNLVARKPYTPSVAALIKLAQRDNGAMVKRIAIKALWPFSCDKVLIRNRVDYDHEVVVKSTIELSKENWLFQTDPQECGHYNKWYDLAADEALWHAIAIEDFWQKAGYNHSGVAWYRKWVEMPAASPHVAVELHFEAVCESAFVWMNGVYVGEHDEGPMGWDKPFAVDITDEIKWSQKNLITVRVCSNLAHAGGIWKPVRIEILGNPH